MSMPVVLAIDLGTGSLKALLVDEQCAVIASASASYPVHRPHDSWAEQDPVDWWNAAVDAIRTVVAVAGDVTIVAIGLSGQMHGTVLLDEVGHPVRPAIIWEDRRSASQVDALTQAVGAGRLIETCGSPVATGFQAATLAWLVEHEPVSISCTRVILLPADYLRFRLTEALTSEPSDASSTLLFDIHKRAWSQEICDAVGIGVELLPSVTSSTAISGLLTPHAAAELGLPAGIAVASGGADAPLAALAAGATTSDTLLLTISTGSQAILPAPQPKVDPAGRIHTWCSLAEPDTGLPAWYSMGATLASGRALRWFNEDILGRQSGSLEAAISSIPAGSDGLIFLPYLNGERTPHMDPNASAAFLGLKAHHGAAELTRAVMEGSVFALFDAFEVLQGLGGSPDRIVLAGGGARSRTWTHIVADVFSLPVDPLEESEGSAMGAAIVAGTSIGWFSLAEGADRAARVSQRIEPNAANATIYTELHEIFQHTYHVLREDLHALGAIASRARASSISA